MHEFSYTPEDPEDRFRATVSVNSPSLEDILQAFEQYLRASGFYFNGKVDIVDDEPPTPTDNP